jgi:hypothetical protein
MIIAYNDTPAGSWLADNNISDSDISLAWHPTSDTNHEIKF